MRDSDAVHAMEVDVARKRRRGLVAATTGTIVEYYDFTVYAYLAVVLAPLFFPGSDPTAALLSSLAIFASAYLMRPIGGVFFGRIGDKHGRKRALLLSVLLMGFASLLMALLPTYETAGIMAPILLVLARLAQGFSAGGELGGAMTYAYEIAGPKRQGLAASFVMLGTTGGFALAATSVGAVSSVLSDDQMSAWGWRIPFILGVPLLLVCLWTRSRIEDSEDYEAMVEQDAVVKSPLSHLLRTHFARTLQAVGICIPLSACLYMVFTYIGIHLVREGGFDRTQIAWVSAAIIAVITVLMPVYGIVTDRIGPIKATLVGLASCSITVFPVLHYTASGSFGTAVMWYLIFGLSMALAPVASAALVPALFESSSRTTGVALANNFATLIAGGTAAYISTWLIAKTGSAVSPAFFVLGTCAIGFISIFAVVRSRSRNAENDLAMQPVEA